MNESDIQFALYLYRRTISGFPMMLPNTYLFSWESDLLYVSKSLYITEWEIKLSRSDFKADMKKTNKHMRLSNKNIIKYKPKFFNYACPTDLIKESEVPEYAGLFYIEDTHKRNQYKFKAMEIKAAPNLKGNAISEIKYNNLLNKGLIHYWHLCEKLRRAKQSN